MAIPPYVILVAFLPLAAYLTLFGAIRMFGRPMVTTGARDIVAIAIAISGLIFLGPIDLFFPESTAALIGGRIWFVLAFLYSLIVLLIIVSSRPRLIVYGMTADRLLPALISAAKTMDPDSSQDGTAGTVTMPTIGIHLRVDSHRGTDVSEVFTFETNVLPAFWKQLRSALTREIASQPRSIVPAGSLSLIAGMLILGFIFYVTLNAHEEVVQGLQQWLLR